ncbi:MAG: chaperonin GroEL, partial [Phycisphaerales bacterium]|nr:chaperonin GroEL [Phycisphaerales bacterium]
MTKQMKFDADARHELRTGVDQIARAVGLTMGPTGRNVVVQKSFGGPSVTKDGVSVAKEVELAQPFENMGAKMINEVAKKTADVAGDGTTCATVLAREIFVQGLRHVTSGASPMALQRGINSAARVAGEAIEEMASSCKDKADLKKIATVSANHDAEIGEFIAEALSKVGPDGVVEVEEGKTSETTLDYVEGMSFDKGFLSPYFMTDPKTAECMLEDPIILVHEKKISSIKDMLPLLEKLAKAGKPLVILAEDVEGEALATLVVNRLRGTLDVCAVKAPGFGDRRKAMMQDIAVLTGGTALFEDLGVKLESATVKDLGSARKVIVTKDDTTIVEGAGKKGDIRART